MKKQNVGIVCGADVCGGKRVCIGLGRVDPRGRTYADAGRAFVFIRRACFCERFGAAERRFLGGFIVGAKEIVYKIKIISYNIYVVRMRRTKNKFFPDSSMVERPAVNR